MEFLYQLLQNIGFDHPLHPPFAHMPIGLVVGAFIFLLAALVIRRYHHQLIMTAYFCIILALIFFFPTAFFGFSDWLYFYNGVWTFPIKIKVILACALLIFLLIAVVMELKKAGGIVSKLVVSLLCLITVVGLGYYGGQITFADRTEAAQGKLDKAEKLYVMNCGSCHPNGGNVFNSAYPVIRSPLIKNFDTFAKFTRQPYMSDGTKVTMPPFPVEKISDEELKQIYQYVTKVLNK